jgi:hypothetical protein
VDVTGPSTIPLPQQARLFPNIAAALSLIAHDGILLQSAISIAAMHQEYLQGLTTFTPATLKERGEAIRLLNQCLSEPVIVPSDGLVVAVSILGACEVRTLFSFTLSSTPY